MKDIFVTLVSEQTIPNLQYIKELGPFKQYIFVSTEKMESKKMTQNIITAAAIKVSIVKILKVNEENYHSIIKQLESCNFDSSSEIIVNCTLGTKIMSIAIFEYFRNKSNATIYYTPIGTNKYMEVLKPENSHNFSNKASVDEYFACYGIQISKTATCLHKKELASKILGIFLNFKSEQYEIVDRLREYRNKGIDIQIVKGLKQFLDNLSYPTGGNGKLSKQDVKYLTGGWFEEWTYYHIKEKYSLDYDQIALGVEVKAIATNDLDVVFLLNNDLYVIECKTTLGKELEQPTIYKSGALIDKFGKAAKAHLYTLQDLRTSDGNLKPAIELRSLQQNVHVIDKSDIINFVKHK